jgi:hypothetical protein
VLIIIANKEFITFYKIILLYIISLKIFKGAK